MKITSRSAGLNVQQISALNALSQSKGAQKPFKNSSLTHAYDIDTYTKQGTLNTVSPGALSGPLSVDKGTAAETTVQINRNAFDAIVSHTTYGDPKWEELGVDDEKRWVVVNGQRFEVEHSPEEKAQRRRAKRMTLVDFMDERQNKDEKKANRPHALDALKKNSEVLSVLKRIFGVKTDAEVFNKILL